MITKLLIKFEYDICYTLFSWQKNSFLVYILNELLTSTYASEFIDYTYPTCISIAGKMSRKYAIKSGTTDTDVLIFGFNKDLLIGAWVGYDDNKLTTSYDSASLKNM